MQGDAEAGGRHQEGQANTEKASRPSTADELAAKWETGSSSDFGSFGDIAGQRDHSGAVGAYGSSSAVGVKSEIPAEDGIKSAAGASGPVSLNCPVMPGSSRRPPRPPQGSTTPGCNGSCAAPPEQERQQHLQLTRRIPKLPMVRLDGKWYRGKTVRVRSTGLLPSA